MPPHRAAVLVSPTLDIAEIDERFHASTPGSRASVTDLLASFFLDSPMGSETVHRDAMGCFSSGPLSFPSAGSPQCGGKSHVQLQNSPGRIAEDLATCTMLLNALEQDFG